MHADYAWLRVSAYYTLLAKRWNSNKGWTSVDCMELDLPAVTLADPMDLRMAEEVKKKLKRV